MTFTKWQSWYLNLAYGDSITSEFRIEAQLNQGDGGSTVDGKLCKQEEDGGKIRGSWTVDLSGDLANVVSIMFMYFEFLINVLTNVHHATEKEFT